MRFVHNSIEREMRMCSRWALSETFGVVIGGAVCDGGVPSRFEPAVGSLMNEITTERSESMRWRSSAPHTTAISAQIR